MAQMFDGENFDEFDESNVAQSSELMKWQQAHVVIEIPYIINTLNWKTTFIKILLVKIPDYSIHQNFALSNNCAIR